MTEPMKEKDVRALRTALICVGLSGVFLGGFIRIAGGQGWTVPIVAAIVGLGVVALGAARRVSAGISRPMRIFIYWMLSALLVLELMVPLNYAGVRRHLAFDWTVKVLGRVDKPLRITTFFVQTHELQGPVFNVVRDLLDQYRKACPNIVIEHVDPSRDTDRMAALQKQMNLEDLSDVASVVFQYGDARKDVSMYKLMPRSLPGAEPDTQNPEQWAFHGEEEFTAAVLEVTEQKHKQLLFTTNHGELDIDKELAEVASELRRDNYIVEKFAGLAQGVPDNCTVLLIAGPDPRAKFTDKEQDVVHKYLLRGGKLFFSVSGGEPTGLEPVIGEFGIYVANNLIIDASSGRSTLSVPVYPAGYHQIVANLRELAIRLDSARTVEAMPPQPGMMGQNLHQAYNLLESGKTCWADSDLASLLAGKVPVFNPKTDKKGPLGLAAVYERPDRLPNGEEYPKDAPRTRLVAVGSGDFMIGRQISVFYESPPEGNVRFFFNAVNWLAEKEELISIPPKRFDFRPLDKMDASAENLIFWLTTAAMPVVFLVLGGVIWLVRRRS